MFKSYPFSKLTLGAGGEPIVRNKEPLTKILGPKNKNCFLVWEKPTYLTQESVRQAGRSPGRLDGSALSKIHEG